MVGDRGGRVDNNLRKLEGVSRGIIVGLLLLVVPISKYRAVHRFIPYLLALHDADMMGRHCRGPMLSRSNNDSRTKLVKEIVHFEEEKRRYTTTYL